MKTESTQQKTDMVERGPIVVVMGHIDHGKSTLLSYIRKSKEELREAGGITQHISAYEVEHDSKDGKKYTLTFLDTPGHEAFGGIRKRGASVADIAILVVSAEDGVKPQTMEALSWIKESKTPFIVAINKIDKPGADINRTKQGLVEKEIYIEGYGGDIPVVAVSAKTGEGIPELFDMIVLVSELENLTGNRNIPGEGVIIESNRDIKKGISATCIIKNGTLEKGMYITSGVATAPVRIMENYLGKAVDSASFSSPVKIIGWDNLPLVGDSFKGFKTRDEAKEDIEKTKNQRLSQKGQSDETENVSTNVIPIIVKADTGSSLEAVIGEIKKLTTERTCTKVIASGIGTISENDVRNAYGEEKAIIIGFNTKVDSPAKNLAERSEIEIQTFDIIYKMSDWLKETLVTRTPKIQTLESVGKAKVLKIFSKVKDKQILGGRVEKGSITLGAQVKIFRRDVEIGEGKVRELQDQKVKSQEVREGKEFGTLIEAKVEIAPGDYVESFITVEK
jgi:translation initiation factor IF-2